MSAPLSTSLPYGLRDVKLTPYVDQSGTVLGTISLDLPNARTYSFSESEEFEQLRGDDRVVTTRGQGAMVEWELEAGGLSLEIWKAMTGGQIIESGIAPLRQKIFRKRGRDTRPWFRIEGQAISDSGGDMHGIVYRCRVTEEMEGEFNDGEFFLTSGSGEGYPLLDDVDDILYDFVQNETAVAIPTTGASNPDPTPA